MWWAARPAGLILTFYARWLLRAEFAAFRVPLALQGQVLRQRRGRLEDSQHDEVVLKGLDRQSKLLSPPTSLSPQFVLSEAEYLTCGVTNALDLDFGTSF